ncbi:MAG: hypothetical protein ACREAK_06840, partial [Nitrosarchaeum sp.]
KMKTKLKIQFLIASLLIAYGLYNMFWFFVYSPILHPPFPFDHVQAQQQVRGTSVEIGYLPLDEAYFHPYWLFWSLTMYFGLGYLAFLVIGLEKNYRNHAIKKSVKIAVILTGVGFGLFVGISFTANAILEVLPEPDPYLKAEFEGLQIYKSGQPIAFSLYLAGYEYTVSYLEMSIKDHDGIILWSNEPYIPIDQNVEKNYFIDTSIPGPDEEPIIIFAPGEYTLEISVSGHTVTKKFSIEF